MAYKTHVVKNQVEAIIKIVAETIEGLIYKMPEGRLLDLLNHESEQFIPVSEAKVYCTTTSKLIFAE